MILDTDEGSNYICRDLHIKNFEDSFINIKDHLYLIFISNQKDKEIEDLFDDKTRDSIIDDKKFNPKKGQDSATEYGKHIFAEKVIKPNKDKIDFTNFEPIFEKIRLVINDCKKNKNTTNIKS